MRGGSPVVAEEEEKVQEGEKGGTFGMQFEINLLRALARRKRICVRLCVCLPPSMCVCARVCQSEQRSL